MQNATGASDGPLTGQQVGQYRFMNVIGRGGMGDVYLARDEHLKRNVAIKALSSRLLEDDLARDRFVRETRLASKVVHPYVATVFDVVDQGSDLLLVMEHIEGRRLSSVLREDRPGPGEISAYAVEIAEGLTAIHRAGLVHRDLKPANVMVTPDGHVKLLDFGVARSMAPGPSGSDESELVTAAATLTEAGLGVGTVAYMSPEQVRGKKDLDQRSDLFSLGTILWEAVTGIHPFRRGSVIDTATAILNEPPGGGSEPETLTGSGPLRHVILRLLEKDPDRRYSTSLWAAQDLRAIVHGQTPSPRAPLVPRPTMRRWTIAALAVLGALAVFETVRRVWPPPPPASSRPIVAVLPFEDRTGQGADPFRGEMLADLLAADLGESGLLRPVSTERVLEITASAGDASAAGLRDVLVRHARLDWLLSGRIWREGDSFIASVSLYSPHEPSATGSFEVRAAATAALVDLASARALKLLFPGTDSRQDVSASRLSSESEEARSLEYRARAALRELRYRDAIALLERATVEDPRFLMAQARLAEALHAAGYGRRAREVADRVGRMVAQPGNAPSERQRLEVAAIQARIAEDVPGEIEARRRLVDAFPDDPGLYFKLARALVDLEQMEEALPIVETGIALDPLDPRGELRRAEALAGLGRHDQAEAALDRADRMFESIGSASGRGSVEHVRGDVQFYRGDYEAGIPHYASSARFFEESELEVHRARAIKAIGDCLLTGGRDLAAAEDRYNEATPIARAAGDYRTLVKTLGSLGAQLYGSGRFDSAEAYLREALELGASLDNPRLMLFPRINLAGLLNYLGRVGEGRSLAVEALETARQLGMRENETMALLLVSDADYQTGDHERAVQAYEDIIRIESGPQGSPRMHSYALAALGEVNLASGRLREALKDIDRAVAMEREASDRYALAFALLLRSHARAEAAQWAAAEDDLRECQALADRAPSEFSDLLPRIQLVRGLIALERGNWTEAAALLDQARSAESTAVRSTVPALVASCEVAIAVGEPERAVPTCKAALDHDSAIAVERTLARSVLAAALAAAGEEPQAAREARRALEEAENRRFPIPGVLAAATLLKLDGVSDSESAARRGGEMLRLYLGDAPTDARDAIRNRADLADAIALIEKANAGS